MRQHLAVARQDTCFRRDDLPALRHRPRLGPHAAAVPGEGPREISLGLDRRVALPRRQQRMTGAARDAVDQGERPAAMNRAHRIEQMLSRFALEGGEALAHLDDPERHRFRDRRLRQRAVDDRLKNLAAAFASELVGPRETIIESRHLIFPCIYIYCIYIE